MLDFRLMTYDDLEEFLKIRNLSREWLHDQTEFELSDTQEWFLSMDYYANYKFWVITLKNRIIGYFRTSSWWNPDGPWIGADIHPDFRGQGIATQLYPEFMRTMIRAFGVKGFYLNVLEYNIRAGKLYTSLGFEQVHYDEEKGDILMYMSAKDFKEIYG
jgi:RimJ/RimL family protein N-acetyltransferase